MDDARVYEAATATELVDRLRALSFLEHGDAADFMAKMAANYAAWDGAIIRADNAEIFVVDHVQYGFLDRV
ncbi:MAG: hypothetical protein P9C55_07310 [Defluviicoccus sp.]|nr:hypothetical protein [Defluviicoccus sp.]